jgi:hypothetical protein
MKHFSLAAAARTHCVRPTARRPFPVLCSRKKIIYRENGRVFAARSGPKRRKRECSVVVVTTLRGSFRRILPSSTIRRCCSLGRHPFNINGTSAMAVRSCERKVPGQTAAPPARVVFSLYRNRPRWLIPNSLTRRFVVCRCPFWRAATMPDSRIIGSTTAVIMRADMSLRPKKSRTIQSIPESFTTTNKTIGSSRSSPGRVWYRFF